MWRLRMDACNNKSINQMGILSPYEDKVAEMKWASDISRRRNN